MKNKTLKHFRFSENTIIKLNDIQELSGKNQTQIIEELIGFLHGEYKRSSKGMEHDEILVSQIIGETKPKLELVGWAHEKNR